MSIETSPAGVSFGRAKTSDPVLASKIAGHEARSRSLTSPASVTPSSSVGALPLINMKPARQSAGNRASSILRAKRACVTGEAAGQRGARKVRILVALITRRELPLRAARVVRDRGFVGEAVVEPQVAAGGRARPDEIGKGLAPREGAHGVLKVE